MADCFRRAGIPDADARAAKVMALETEIAKRQWGLAERRDVVRMNNVMSPGTTGALCAGLPLVHLPGRTGLHRATPDQGDDRHRRA